MLESLVSGILNRILGSYVDNFDPKQLNIGVWSGNVKLHNLKIKPEAVDKFGLPVSIISGVIGTLNLEIPWQNLRKKPLKVRLEDIYLLVFARNENSISEEQIEANKQSLKQEKLGRFELVRRNVGVPKKLPASKKVSFIESLITKLTDNLQLSIERIHVRYEDTLSSIERPFALGITLHEVSALSTNNSTLLQSMGLDPSQYIFKNLLLDSFSLYCHSDSRSVYSEDSATLLQNLKNSIPRSEHPCDHHYILNPVMGSGYIIISRQPSLSEPRLRFAVEFDELAFTLNDGQYSNFLNMVDYFKVFLCHQQYIHFRPKVSSRADPLAWFRYAIVVVKESIHNRNYQWTWEYFKKRRDIRLEYVQLYYKKIKHKDLSKSEKQRLNELEHDNSADDLITYRSIVYKKLEREVADTREQGSWMGRISAIITRKKEPHELEQRDPDDTSDDSYSSLVFTDAQKQEFYSAIEYNDETDNIASSHSPSYVLAEFSLKVHKGGLSLITGYSKEKKSLLMEITFQEFVLNIFARYSSIRAEASLVDLNMIDGVTRSNELPMTVICVKERGGRHIGNVPLPKQLQNCLFYFNFDTLSNNKSASSKLEIYLKRLLVLYHRRCVESIILFLKPPRVKLEHVSVWGAAAAEALMSYAKQSRASLDFALENHKSIDVFIDIQAPLIAVRENPNSDSSDCLILDIGRVIVHSQLLDPATINKFKSLQSQQINREQFVELQNLMYDKFLVSLISTKCVIAPSFDIALEAIDKPSPHHILKECSLDILIEVCILPLAVNFTRFRVSSHMDFAEIGFTDIQYKVFISIMLNLLPTFPEAEVTDIEFFNTLITKSTSGTPSYRSLTDLTTEQESGSDNAEFVDAVSETNEAQFLAQQLFAFDFDVSDVVLTAYRLDNDKIVPILRATFHFIVDLRIRHFDYSVAVELRRFTAREFAQSGNLFNNALISSLPSPSNEKNSSVKIEYTCIDLDSPEFESVYKGIESTVNITIEQIQFNVVPSSFLVIYEYITSTFPNSQNPLLKLRYVEPPELRRQLPANANDVQQMDVNIRFDRLDVVLYNEDGHFSTVSLIEALLHFELTNDLAYVAKLSQISVFDYEHSAKGTPVITIHNDNFIDLEYRSQQINVPSQYPVYDSHMKLTVGSLNLFFEERFFSTFYSFLLKLSKLKSLLDTAERLTLNQLSTEDQEGKFTFEVKLHSPIVHFETVLPHKNNDTITLIIKPGVFKFYNTFDYFDSKEKQLVCIDIYNVNACTQPANSDDVEALLEDTNFSFKFIYIHEEGQQHDILSIDGITAPIDVHLSEDQYLLFWDFFYGITGFYKVDEEKMSNKVLIGELQNVVLMETEISKRIPLEQQPYSIETKLRIPRLSFSLFKKSSLLNDDFRKRIHSIVNFLDLTVSFDVRIDGSTYTEVKVRDSEVTDARYKTNNCYPLLCRPSSPTEQYLMMSLYMPSDPVQRTILLLDVDSASVVVNREYCLSLKDLLSKWNVTYTKLVKLRNLTKAVEMNDPSELRSKVLDENDSSWHYRVTFADLSLIFLEDGTQEATKALEVRFTELLMTQQSVFVLNSDRISVYSAFMDKFQETRTRVFDDFQLRFTYSVNRIESEQIITSAALDFDPLILRTTLTDLKFVYKMLSMVYYFYYELYEVPPISENLEALLEQSLRLFRAIEKPEANMALTFAICKEEFNLSIGGIKILLISEHFDLPILNLNINSFVIEFSDWSSEFNVNTNLASYVSFYNFANSHWEPLLEPWKVTLHVARSQAYDKTIFTIISRKTLEVVLTPQLLETLLLGFKKTKDETAISTNKSEAPYRIKNVTGFDVNIWSDFEGTVTQFAYKLNNGEETEWKFEEWRQINNALDTDQERSCIGLKFDGPENWNTLRRVHVNRVGEHLLPLIAHDFTKEYHIVAEITLSKDYVKHIVLRSAVLILNETHMDLEVLVGELEGGGSTRIYKVRAGETFSPTIREAYEERVRVRPPRSLNYAWSNESLYWKDLLDCSPKLVTCNLLTDAASKCNFAVTTKQMHKKSSYIYPYLHLHITATLEVENLLPFDIQIRIVDKETQGITLHSIEKRACLPIHSVELDHLLLLQLQLFTPDFHSSSYLPISHQDDSDCKHDKTLSLLSVDGRTTRIGAHFTEIHPGIYRVGIYSHYIILNKCRIPVNVRYKNESHSQRTSTCVVPAAKGEKAVPFLFSYWKDDRKNRAMLSCEFSRWSEKISFDAIGSAYEVELESISGLGIMKLGVDVESGPGIYRMTKVITITPRFILRNLCPLNLKISDLTRGNGLLLKAGSCDYIRFMNKASDNFVMLAAEGSDSWTSPLCIENLGTTHIILSQNSMDTLIKADISLVKGAIMIKLKEETKQWPFAIRNETDYSFEFWQAVPDYNEKLRVTGLTNSRRKRYVLGPNSRLNYSWDFPAAQNKDILLSHGKQEYSTTLAEIGALLPLRFFDEHGKEFFISRDIYNEKGQTVLVLRNYNSETSVYKQKKRVNKKKAALEHVFELEKVGNDVQFSFQLKVQGLGISLVNDKTQELLYLSLRDIIFAFNDSPTTQTYRLEVKWLQIDNQLYGGIYPIVLYPTVIPQVGTSENTGSYPPAFYAMVSILKNTTYGVTYVKYATMLLQELSVEIDEDFAFAMLDFMKSAWKNYNDNENDELFNDALQVDSTVSSEQGNAIYFELIHLQPAQLNLSFMRTERINRDISDKVPSRSPFVFLFNVLSMAIGSINDAPLRINSLLMDNVHLTIQRMSELIKNHYSQELTFQIHKIVGSADLLGNPVGLFNTVSSGIADIFYEPYHGFVLSEGSYDFGMGVARGTASFVKKTVFGISDSISKVTGSISKSLSMVTLDKKFQTRRRNARIRNRPEHVLYGVTAGAISLITGFRSGITGVVMQPWINTRAHGVPGFFEGVGKGILGLTTKPLVGLFDCASSLSEGVRNTTTVFDGKNIQRVRMSRLISKDGIVYPYSSRDALGQFWMKTLKNGRYFRDYYKAFAITDNGTVVILTDARIIFMKTNRLRTIKERDIDELESVHIVKDKLILKFVGQTKQLSFSHLTTRNYMAAKIQNVIAALKHSIAYSQDE
ncbi:vacuolar protein sorting-associated protein 13a [Schizosaccharomyces japonicus yFS275]|uniref:Vacuolar protein sorting-associated protein 13a n=1 Tax=Schizosaccharomyces japonicus (strain yFS275 / FY16936) TaxID=402676 RepID=B6K041_SCHJY|nr:vacuolar protein sorting-associated protein 13a [Schizosaccharomyces japonicus yFS275]EEB06191.1 vacuolar protein sorting-associated protein 13a [Schizosaccharomyces japonicus yFS275]